MADYAIVIKAYSKIVCHALSRIKTQTMLWPGLWLYFIYCLFMPIFFMSGRLYRIMYQCLFIPNFFLLGPLCNVNFTANLASRGFIGIFDHRFHGYSNRQLHFPHINIAHIGQLDFESRNLYMMFIRQKLWKH